MKTKSCNYITTKSNLIFKIYKWYENIQSSFLFSFFITLHHFPSVCFNNVKTALSLSLPNLRENNWILMKMEHAHYASFSPSFSLSKKWSLLYVHLPWISNWYHRIKGSSGNEIIRGGCNVLEWSFFFFFLFIFFKLIYWTTNEGTLLSVISYYYVMRRVFRIHFLHCCLM